MSATKTCLVVDDSDVIREIAMRIITDLGLETKGVSNASEAMEYCRGEAPAAVFLDWDLPSMGALDFLRGAASFEGACKPEIILCATENDEQQFTLARAAGANHHILKPFDKFAIASKLAELGLIDAEEHPELLSANG
ncbi:response regulator [Hyphococcus formosus]|uniref:response regulator n=1 Tax=Hyphococcus formosus TaxID=3143534 RepID=UPI00398B5D19